MTATGAFVLWPDVAAFEESFAAFSGAAHCVGVANGTDALELALRAQGVGPGAEVILPANTFVATAEAVSRVGAQPVLVDCDPDHLLIDPPLVAKALTDRTRAVMAVHLYGQMAPVDALADLLPPGVDLVEDAAQSQGATHHGRRSGSTGAVAGTSFYPGKNLGAYGDAGAVLTSDDAAAATLRALRDHGGTQVPRPRRHELAVGHAPGRGAAGQAGPPAGLERAAPRGRPPLRRPAGGPRRHRPPGDAARQRARVAPVRRPGGPARRRAGGPAGGRDRGRHPLPHPVHLLGAYAHLGYGPGDFPVAEAAAGRS